MRIAFVKIVSVSQNALYFGNNKEKYQGFYFMHSIDWWCFIKNTIKYVLNVEIEKW